MAEQGFPPETLLLVPSVQAWATSHGLPEPNPFRQAKAFPESGLIVMVSSLTVGDARSSGSVLTRGPDDHDWLAGDLRRYAKFLLLHKVAHLRGLRTERDADEWALGEVRKRDS
jgi:hypothetical protein